MAHMVHMEYWLPDCSFNAIMQMDMEYACQFFLFTDRPGLYSHDILQASKQYIDEDIIENEYEYKNIWIFSYSVIKWLIYIYLSI